MVVGDFNGDGKPDLAITDQNATLYVLFGNGDGTFTAGPTRALPHSAGIEAADPNQDGKLDLLVSWQSYESPSSQPYFIQAMLGNGDGTFGALRPIISSNALYLYFVVGDFNGDGYPDLIVSEYSGDTPGVSLYLGKGDGAFQPPTVVDSHLWLAIEAADFNDDGKLDFVVTNFQDQLAIWFGNGDGTFRAGPITSNFPPFTFFFPADVNGDGYPDILLVNYPDNSDLITIYLGNGDGTFTIQPANIPSIGQNAAVGDMIGDGKLDIVSAGTGVVTLINTTPN
jgi:hypothetical protein